MKKLIIIVAALLGSGLLGAFGTLWWLADEAAIGARLSAALEQRSGRPVTLGSAPRLQLGWQPVMHIEGLRIAGADAAAAPMLEVSSLRAQLGLRALLDAQLHLPAVELSGVRLRPDAASRALLTPGASPTATSALTLRIDSLHLRDAELQLDGTTPLTLRVHEGLLRRGSDAEVELDLQGRVGGQAVTLAGTVQPGLDAATVQVDLSGTALQGEFALRGALPRDPGGGMLDLQVRASAAQLALAGRLGGALPALRLSELQGQVAGTSVGGELRLDTASSPARLGGELRLGGLDLRSRPAMPGGNAQDPTLPATGPAPAAAQPGLPTPDTDVQLEVEQVLLPGLTLNTVQTRVLASGDTWGLESLRADSAGGQLRGRLGWQGRGTAARVELQMQAQGLALHQIPALAAASEDVQGRLDAAVDLRLRGAEPNAWRHSVSGSARAMLHQGRARARTLENLVGGIHTLLGTLTASDAAWIDINCAAADFRIEDGVAHSRLLVLDSRHATVLGEGRIDIANGQLHLLASPRPRSATLNLAVPVRIEGPVNAPRFRIDETAAARRIGGLVAGVLVFPPALLAAFADLGHAESGCLGAQVLESADRAQGLLREGGAALEQAGRATREAGSAIGNAGQQAAEKVEQGIDAIGRGFGRLFGN